MSVDSPTSDVEDHTGAATCSLCGQGLGDGCRFVSCYPAEGRATPSPAADDGVVGVCDRCAAEVDELVDAWTAHEDPPVDGSDSIHAGYVLVAEECSFCDRSIGDEPPLGVEYYRRDAAFGDADGADANYSLCDGCAPVFAEFLDNVGRDESV